MQLQFAAEAYEARSPQLISQQCINAFVETAPREAKTQVPFFGTPGLTLFSRMGTSPGPITGMHIFADDLYITSGPDLYQIKKQDALDAINGGGAVTPNLIGATSFGSSLVEMADNGTQLIMVDGYVGWIYQPAGLNLVSTVTGNAGDTSITANVTGTVTNGDTLNIPLDSGTTFTTTATATVSGGDSVSIPLAAPLPSQVTAGAVITDPANVLGRIVTAAFMSAATVQYFDGYFVLEAAGTRQFFISSINDGTQYSGLDFATATASSSNIMAVTVYHEQLLLFTDGLSTEIWWDTGNQSFPFQRYDAAQIARGIAAPHARCLEDNTVFWLGDDGIFYRLNGFTPQRISTFAMEHAWAQYPNRYLDAQCFVLDQEGHKFIIVNFPSGNQTWGYDISTGKWHQRESWGNAQV